jgi:hypothetical protein
MTINPQKAYRDFWESLLPAYPISKGSLRLPIATTLLKIPDFNYTEFKKNLLEILESLLEKEGTQKKACLRAQAAGDHKLVPLIDEEYTGIVRFDCLWNPNTKSVSILEINCDYPDGLLLHDKTVSSLSGETCTRHQNLYNELFDTNEVVDILYSPEAHFIDGYQAEADHLKGRGHGGTFITDTSRLKPKHTVRRCLETTKLTDKHTADLVAFSPRLVNSIALRTLGYKNLLEKINHPYVPTTTNVSLQTINFCIENKDTLVLKPADGCEGVGIYFGNSTTDTRWLEYIQAAANKNYVAQKLVHIPKMNVSLYENDTIVEKRLYYDLCPHFFIKNGQVIGTGHTLMRFSENAIVNVSRGGGIGYYNA